MPTEDMHQAAPNHQVDPPRADAGTVSAAAAPAACEAEVEPGGPGGEAYFLASASASEAEVQPGGPGKGRISLHPRQQWGVTMLKTKQDF